MLAGEGGRSMKTRRLFCSILTFSAFGLITSLPQQAQARACSLASDCPTGYECAADVGADGGHSGLCASLPCQSNSDCGPGFTCYQAVPGGPGMTVIVTAACAQATAVGGLCSPCVPRWDMPCIGSSDSGPGFTSSPGSTSFTVGRTKRPASPH